MATLQEYITLDEAAASLGVSKSTLRRWIKQGDMPAYRFGRRMLVKREDLEKAIKPAGEASKRRSAEFESLGTAIKPLTEEELESLGIRITPLTGEEVERIRVVMEESREWGRAQESRTQTQGSAAPRFHRADTKGP